ncbi:MAG TPA: nucleoside recognition domain-containing protein [Anaerolineales bacterium]|nr:nucleoside recognition domain-containing protein [Anaerolineales bacterium]
MTITFPPLFQLDYGGKIEREIARVIKAFEEMNFNTGPYSRRWLAIKLLEKDADILERIQGMNGGGQMIALASERAQHVESMLGEDFDLLIADGRYGYINGVVRQSLHRPLIDRTTLTDRVDNFVTHKWLGLPVFFAIMYIVFRLVIDVSAPFLDWIDAVINGPIYSWIASLLDLISAPAWIESLLLDGILAGVGGVLVFVPGLLILYFFLALLEDSGYMSRAAFVMDRFMRIVGLHGKSFIPMILGFGCAVPAVYDTRTIASRRDRVLTALLVPLMSCSARLPGFLRREGRHGHLGDVRTRHCDCHACRYGLHPHPPQTRRLVCVRAGTAALSPACSEERPHPHVGEYTRVHPKGRDDHPDGIGCHVVPVEPALGCHEQERILFRKIQRHNCSALCAAWV